MTIFADTISTLYALALFVNSCIFLPQAYRIYKKKNSDEVSLLTFVGFNLINLLAVVYGITKADWVLIVGYGLSFSTNTLTTILIIYYRK